jgi:hypothetical protein
MQSIPRQFSLCSDFGRERIGFTIVSMSRFAHI